MFKLISGKEISLSVKERVAEEVKDLKKTGIEPCLAVILVGDDPASYGNLLREYDRRRESGHGCGGYFHERPPDRGELPGRYTDDFRPGS